MADFYRKMIPSPCGRNCPERAVGCAVGCKRWAEYVEIRDKEYARRAEAKKINDAICDGYDRIAGRKR